LLTLEEEGRRREGEREMRKGKEEEAVRGLSRVWDLRWLAPGGEVRQVRRGLA
jgi:hypothetical protein